MLDREQLKIWLVTVGEPLPVPGETARLWRCGLIARELASRGHAVTWWSSTFDHVRKLHLPADVHECTVLGSVRLRLLHGIAYRRNVSVARLVNHYQVAREFMVKALACGERPDLIVASFPTIELADASVQLADRFGVPCVIDVRDLWPDIFVSATPVGLRGLARLALAPYFRATKRAISNATALMAVSSRYLDWGVAHAGRARREGDRVFPLGYEPVAPSPDDVACAQRLVGQQAPGQLLAVFAGSFGRTYDLSTVIEAARRLDAEGKSRWSFILCGTGEREAAWREQSAGLAHVVFTGLLSAGQLAAVMALSRIGLAAYAAGAPQGIPNKLIEYTAAGLPVVGSLQGEASELMRQEDFGLTYEAGSPDSLIGALQSLERDPARFATMARCALAVYDRQFSAGRVFSGMADSLYALASGGVSVDGK